MLRGSCRFWSGLALARVPQRGQLVRKKIVFSAFLLVGLVGLAVPARSQTGPRWTSDQEWLSYQEALFTKRPDGSRTSCAYYRQENRRGGSVFDSYANQLASAHRRDVGSDFPTSDAFRSFLAWQTGNFCPDVW